MKTATQTSDIDFAPIRSQRRRLFQEWVKENPAETVSFNDYRELDWFYIIQDHTNIGWVVTARTIPGSLRELLMIYIKPEYRGQGRTILVRDALRRDQGVLALRAPRYIDNPDLLTQHQQVASKSGFRRHYVTVANVNNQPYVLYEWLIHDDVQDIPLPNGITAWPIENFRKIQQILDMIG